MGLVAIEVVGLVAFVPHVSVGVVLPWKDFI